MLRLRKEKEPPALLERSKGIAEAVSSTYRWLSKVQER
jgi:hypothetical protein